MNTQGTTVPCPLIPTSASPQPAPLTVLTEKQRRKGNNLSNMAQSRAQKAEPAEYCRNVFFPAPTQMREDVWFPLSAAYFSPALSLAALQRGKSMLHLSCHLLYTYHFPCWPKERLTTWCTKGSTKSSRTLVLEEVFLGGHRAASSGSFEQHRLHNQHPAGH